MRKTLAYAALLATLFAIPHVNAQAWPDRPVTLLVPFSAGGPTDFIARLVAERLSAELGQRVLVENRPGASGTLGYQTVLAGEADGYTLLHNTVGMQAINPLMYPQSNLNPDEDFVTIGITGAMPNVLVVNPDVHSARTVAQFVDEARAAPQEFTYAHFGPGSSPHIYGSLLQKAGSITAVAVPYNGSANAQVDVLGGQVDFLFDSMTTSIGAVQAGALRALAVTSGERSLLLPDVPTLAESGYEGVDLEFWFSIQAPAGAPQDIVNRLREATENAVQDESYQAALRERGAEPVHVPPAELDEFVAQATARWVEAAELIDLQPE